MTKSLIKNIEPVHGKWIWDAIFNVGEISCLGQELSNFMTSFLDSSRDMVAIFLPHS